MSLSNLWSKIPVKWQAEIISSLHTFFWACCAELVVEFKISNYALPTSKTALVALLATVGRAGGKALVTFLVNEYEKYRSSNSP